MGIPEVWTGSSWRALTGANRLFQYYPRTFVAPNGKIFYAGEEKISRWLNTSNAGAWTVGPSHISGARDYGAAVMYLPGKILYVGGGRTSGYGGNDRSQQRDADVDNRPAAMA